MKEKHIVYKKYAQSPFSFFQDQWRTVYKLKKFEMSKISKQYYQLKSLAIKCQSNICK